MDKLQKFQCMYPIICETLHMQLMQLNYNYVKQLLCNYNTTSL
jgi:hypothetical protein